LQAGTSEEIIRTLGVHVVGPLGGLEHFPRRLGLPEFSGSSCEQLRPESICDDQEIRQPFFIEEYVNLVYKRPIGTEYWGCISRNSSLKI
jgi:hypothetical protein